MSEDSQITSSVRDVLREVLQIGDRADALSSDSPLLGHMPELDSMAIATLLAALEDRFDVTVYDDEVEAATFETFGDLCSFVETKVAA